MPHFQIKRWDTGAVIYEGEAKALKDLVNTASKEDINLYRASLVGARLDGARLIGARLDGASLIKGKIVSLRVFAGLYKYTILAYVLKDGLTPCVKMGCLDFTLAEWDAKGWILESNPSEFPNDQSTESMRRKRAYDYARAEAYEMAKEAANA